MIHHKRKSFRPRPKNGFRRRNGSSGNPISNSQINNGNLGYIKGGSYSNPLNIEKAIKRFKQLAKDAQSSGDLVLVENYLQHADHYARKLSEISSKHQTNQKESKFISREPKKEEESLAKILTDNSQIKKT
tara:strand:+ start:1065 stop:1457 length:393 start_codon:yes stop_codon:yes gene_type:complete